jgi:hypothetical protein
MCLWKWADDKFLREFKGGFGESSTEMSRFRCGTRNKSSTTDCVSRRPRSFFGNWRFRSASFR